MRHTLRKIVNVLDGQPTGARGQSLVELAITAPLLILMILSMVEVGFVANDYLILMDVVRGAGRDAVNLDPTTWNDKDTRNQQRLDCDTIQGADEGSRFLLKSTGETADDRREIPRARGLPGLGSSQDLWGYNVGQESAAYGFFDEVVCQVTKSMSPMVFNDYSAMSPYPGDPANPNARDDIVVSAISYSKIDYNLLEPFQHGLNYGTDPGDPGPGGHNDVWVTVTGRWPLANRYCASVGPGGAIIGDARDPFDWKRADFKGDWHNGHEGDDPKEWVPTYYVLSGTNMIPFNTNPPPPDGSGPTGILSVQDGTGPHPTDNQGIRGFIFTGTQKQSDGCYGSRFTVQDIESRLNLDAAWNPSTPNGGLVLVEVFWQYHPLVLGPIFESFSGNKVDDPVLWVWGFFPVPAVESTATPRS